MVLNHVIAAAQDIKAFPVQGRQAVFADRKTQSAVIRQREITSGAVKNPSPEL